MGRNESGTKYFLEDGNRHGNMCSLLTKTGCILGLNERPYECRALAPSSDFKCSGNNNEFGIMSSELYISWIPFQEKMRKLLKGYLTGLNAKQVTNLRVSKGELFRSMVDEGFMGMYIGMDGKVKFS